MRFLEGTVVAVKMIVVVSFSLALCSKQRCTQTKSLFLPSVQVERERRWPPKRPIGVKHMFLFSVPFRARYCLFPSQIENPEHDEKSLMKEKFLFTTVGYTFYACH